MADVFTKAKRSTIMSLVRGRGNKTTEIRLARLMRRIGIVGWRRHQAVFGNPDFIFPQKNIAIFVDGCFWHGCPRHYSKPKGNAVFWFKKIEQNKNRDRRVTRRLRSDGWQVIRIWEHQLEKPEGLIKKLRSVMQR